MSVTGRRTARNFAGVIRDLVDVQYPDADKTVLVLDNLNTHTAAILYEAFESAEARRFAAKLEIHYTTRHGSWLNMAEIELSVLARQCLDRRLPDRQTLEREVLAWATAHNQAKIQVQWRFTTQDARIRLKKLNPNVQS